MSYSQAHNPSPVVGKERRNHARDVGFAHFHQQFWPVEVDRESAMEFLDIPAFLRKQED